LLQSFFCKRRNQCCPYLFPLRKWQRTEDGNFTKINTFYPTRKEVIRMAVFRIEKTRDYTVMSNHHLRNTELSLKAKGLLSMMLSLPEEWNYTTRGLASICKEGTESIGTALKELERTGYIVRNRLRDSKGKITDVAWIKFIPKHILRFLLRPPGNKRSSFDRTAPMSGCCHIQRQTSGITRTPTGITTMK